MLIEAQVLTVIATGIILRAEGRSVAQYWNAGNGESPVHSYNDEYSEEQQEYLDRQARDITDNANGNTQQNDDIHLRSNNGDEAITNGVNVGYQSRMNGDDEDLAHVPDNEVAMDERVADEEDMKQNDNADTELEEQRDEETVRFNANAADPIDRAVEPANYRQPRQDIANQDNREAAKTEVVGGDTAEIGYEGVHDSPADQPANEAIYPGAEQDRNDYNYVQEQDGGEGIESQQSIGAGNEGVPPAQYEQSVNK